jgi:hypothetical protein
MGRLKQNVELHNVHKFDERFVEFTCTHSTYQEAYEGVEKLYIKAFGTRRFKNFDSYRNSRKRRINKQKKG